MAKNEETFVHWLRDAYAMEKQAMDLMESQLNRVQNYPEFHRQLQLHLEETKAQLETVHQCLRRYNSEPSTLKEMSTRFMGSMQSFMTSMAEDEVLKYGIASYAFESFEVASYRINITAAEALGDNETRQALQGILDQELRQQRWIEENLPTLTRTYLERETAGSGSAKR